MASEKGCPPRAAEKSLTPDELKVATESLCPHQEKVTIDRPQPGFKLPRHMRILKRNEFLHVQNNGQKLYCKQFLIIYTDSTRSTSRLGVVVTRKIDKRAVYRNLIKRKLREVFRLHQSKINRPFDFVIVARKNAADCSLEDIERQMLGALRHGGLLS